MPSGSSFILGKSPRGGYKQTMGCHRLQRASHSLAIGPAVSRLSTNVLVADRAAPPAQTAVDGTADAPRRGGRRAVGEEAGATAAAPVLVRIGPDGSVGAVNDRWDVETCCRGAPPATKPLTAGGWESRIENAREPAREGLLAAAATALCEPRPAARTWSRGMIKTRGRPHSAAA